MTPVEVVRVAAAVVGDVVAAAVAADVAVAAVETPAGLDVARLASQSSQKPCYVRRWTLYDSDPDRL